MTRRGVGSVAKPQEVLATDGKRWAIVREFGELRLLAGVIVSTGSRLVCDGVSVKLGDKDANRMIAALVSAGGDEATSMTTRDGTAGGVLTPSPVDGRMARWEWGRRLGDGFVRVDGFRRNEAGAEGTVVRRRVVEGPWEEVEEPDAK